MSIDYIRDLNLRERYEYKHPENIAVVVGKIQSIADIVIHAKTIVIVGSLISASQIILKADDDFYHANGMLKSEQNCSIQAGNNVFMGFTSEQEDALTSFGLVVDMDANVKVSVNYPIHG